MLFESVAIWGLGLMVWRVALYHHACRYRIIIFKKTDKPRADVSSCRKILDAANCRGWARGKTKIFLKYEHIASLMQALQKKAAELKALQDKIDAQRKAREDEEARIEAMRAKQLADIRAAAEAQPSKIEKTAAPPPKSHAVSKGRAKFSMNKKKKDRRPSLTDDGSGGADGTEPGTVLLMPPAISRGQSSRATGMKKKAFSVFELANKFGPRVGGTGDTRAKASLRKSIRKANKNSDAPAAGASMRRRASTKTRQQSTRQMLRDTLSEDAVDGMAAVSESAEPVPPPKKGNKQSIADLKAKLGGVFG